MMKRLLGRIEPGHALLIGAILLVLGPVVGGFVGLFGVGMARGAEIWLAVAPILGIVALIGGAIIRKRDTDEEL